MSNTAAQLPPLMTVADFLNWPGDGTGVIFELVDGVVRALDPASDTHNTIFGNLQGHIWQHLRAHRPQCRVVPTAGLQPRLRANWNWRVPEIAVTYAPNRQGVHPTEGAILIAEILSPTNENDTWGNVPLYASLPSVAEILIVDATKVAAELLRRGSDGSWPQEPDPIAPNDTIHLASIGLDIPLAEVYTDTYLAETGGV